jgi:hypothetical protein
MEDQVKTPAELALEALAQTYAYYDAQKPTQSQAPEPQEYFEYLAAA